LQVSERGGLTLRKRPSF